MARQAASVASRGIYIKRDCNAQSLVYPAIKRALAYDRALVREFSLKKCNRSREPADLLGTFSGRDQDLDVPFNPRFGEEQF